MRTRPRVAITQPYVPAYRVRLFELVVGSLADLGVDAHVFYGGDAEQMRRRRGRGDMADVPWASEVVTRVVRVGRTGRHLVRRRIPGGWRDGVLVTEMQAGNLDGVLAAVRRRPFVTWGHGASYTADEVPAAARVESWVNRRAAHVLTYTEAGRRSVLRASGLPADRVTSFDNATDTTALQRELGLLDAVALDRYRSSIGLPADASPALVLGALNEHKLPLLVRDAALRAFGQDPSAWLLVGGDGPAAPVFRDLAERTGRVILLGQLGTADVARAGAVSRLLLNPGRVGLVAVDALALGLPVLTTDAGRHAPEVDYLTEGIDLFTVPGASSDVAEAWLRLAATDRPTRSRAQVPSTEVAADRIVRTVHRVVKDVA